MTARILPQHLFWVVRQVQLLTHLWHHLVLYESIIHYFSTAVPALWSWCSCKTLKVSIAYMLWILWERDKQTTPIRSKNLARVEDSHKSKFYSFCFRGLDVLRRSPLHTGMIMKEVHNFEDNSSSIAGLAKQSSAADRQTARTKGWSLKTLCVRGTAQAP